jgi:hypothetical protein
MVIGWLWRTAGVWTTRRPSGSFGRKCFREKLCNVSLFVPTTYINGEERVDEEAIGELFPSQFQTFIPERSNNSITVPMINWQSFNILDIFELKRGDFHSIAALDQGPYMTVSRVTSDNGVVGYLERPEKATIYQRSLITVSTVGGDAFVQLDDFIATDNVIVCRPKKPLRITTLFFLAFTLNQQKIKALITSGVSIRQTAKQLQLSTRTVRKYKN